MRNEAYEFEIDFKGRARYVICAPTEKRAEEILYDRIENEKYNLLEDGDLKEWEINAVDIYDR